MRICRAAIFALYLESVWKYEEAQDSFVCETSMCIDQEREILRAECRQMILDFSSALFQGANS